MRTCRLCIAALLLSVTLDSNAETISLGGLDSEPQLHWVVGSYRDREAALAQSDKLSLELGMVVLVARAVVTEQTLYRLVIAAEEDDEERMSQQLQLNNAGIERPWTTLLDMAEAITYPGYADVEESGLFYVILVSLTDSSEAQLFADSASEKIGLSTSVSSAEVNGQIYHRVLLGPYYREEDAEFTKQMVMDEKVGDPWILAEDNDYSIADQFTSRADELLKESVGKIDEPTTTDVKPLQTVTSPVQKKSAGYNFATLKRRAEPFPFTASGALKKKNAEESGPATSP
jgi:hypothetical protein|tara:strand:+ start:27035 stop:27898 length:864 start_codon:yes stop_codon:yes gene_type:complete